MDRRLNPTPSPDPTPKQARGGAQQEIQSLKEVIQSSRQEGDRELRRRYTP